MNFQSNFSAPFVRRPVATSLVTIAIFLSGAIAFRFLPVAPLPQVDLPVVVLSTSSLVVDVQMAKKLGALDYMAKPVDQDEMIKVVLTLHERWLSGRSPAKSDLAERIFLRNPQIP